MSRGRPRALIPATFIDLSAWPRPDELQIDASDIDEYRVRRDAVSMYAAGAPDSEILNVTSKNAPELRRLVKRCVVGNGAGGIVGFYALLPGLRLKPYTRTKPVLHEPGSGSGGCAGALQQVFSAYPDIKTLIDDLFLKYSKNVVHEARIPYYAMHRVFKDALRKAGFQDSDWPFNTTNKGYDALRRYCEHLRAVKEGRYVMTRFGAEALRRRNLGNGERSVLPALRPGAGMILDYLKVDAASVFIFTNEWGEEFEVPLARWHIGLLVEERWHLIHGYCIALELTPSGDSALETVESALRPQVREPNDPAVIYIVDGKVLPNEQFSQLALAGFCWLKVDNAWCNTATQVVNNLMDVIGCAINFGPVRAWWRRQVIERINGELTRRGLQRLVSTYGSGPGDTRRDDPGAQAVKFRIRKDELVQILNGVIREINEGPSEALQSSSPLSAVEHSLRNPASGWLWQPLPRGERADLRLMRRVEIHPVLGSKERREAPYVNILRERRTCPKLAANFDLIGKKLVCYIDRRDPSNATATVQETGEDLGPLAETGRWSRFKISWRDRQFLIKAGSAKRLATTGVDTVTQFTRAKGAEIKERSRNVSKRTKIVKEGLEFARIEEARRRAADLEANQHPPAPSHAPPSKPRPRDPFGLDAKPDVRKTGGDES